MAETNEDRKGPWKIGSKFKALDDFGQIPAWSIGQGRSGGGKKYRSYLGAFLTVLTMITTGIFMYSKAMVLYHESDVTIYMSYLEGALTYEDTFSVDDGLFVAAALTEYDSNKEIIEEERYGELIIEHYGWGYSDTFGNASLDLDFHYCTDEELGYSIGPKTRIFPVFEDQKYEVDIYRKKFKCVNESDLIIWGDYSSRKT